MSEQTITQMIPVSRLTIAANVRTQSGLNPESITELAASIKEHGLLQPIVVVQHEDGYAVIAGQRRTLAAVVAKLDEIPAIVLSSETDGAKLKAAQIVENIQRENLSLGETANAVREMLAMLGKPALVSASLKKSKAWVSKHLTLSSPNFSPAVRELMNSGDCQDIESLLTLNQIWKLDTGSATVPHLVDRIKAGTIGRQGIRDALDALKSTDQADEGEGDEEGEGDDEPTGKATITFDLSAKQAKQFEDLGGAQWLRRHLKKLERATH